MKKSCWHSIVLVLVLSSCTSLLEEEVAAEAHFRNYCGSCHVAPNPANIPKLVWEEHVFPEMAARMGYKYNGYDPLANNSMEENLYIRLSKTYPEKPIIDSMTWQQIHDYVLSQAPDSIPYDTTREKRNADLTQFKAIPVSFAANNRVSVTNLQFEPTTNQIIVGDVYGTVHQWPNPAPKIPEFHSPNISFFNEEDGIYVTEIGYMNPSEKPLGAIYRIQNEVIDTLARKLHRPVFTEITDLNDDGQSEILICEFGNLLGELSMLVHIGSQMEKRTLLPVPGTIKVEIADMDKDGKKDIVVLAAQGNEGVYILLQKDDLQFQLKQVIKLPPVYGVSWFELIDYNNDQHLDILLANGDNADHSIFLKPYHGVRLFLNNSDNSFTEKWFYPIYGATRVLSADYDLDGDLDFAVMSFFPDFDNTLTEGFVFLENKDPAQYFFKSFTFQEAISGRWMVMDQGDFDQDGDIDIALGSFLLPINRKKYKNLIDHWRKEMVDVMVLENQAIQ